MSSRDSASFSHALTQVLRSCEAHEILDQNSQTVPDNVRSGLDVRGIAKDLGTTLHSQSTKLSLAAKPPRTEEGVRVCLQEIQKILPIFAVLCQGLHVRIYGAAVCDHIRNQSRYALLGLQTLVDAVYEEPVSEARLSRTGVLWGSCIALQKVAELHVLVSQRIKESSQMIEDAIEDLESWGAGDQDMNFSDYVDSESEDELPPKDDPSAPVTSLSEPRDVVRRTGLLKRLRILLMAIDKRKIGEKTNVPQLNDIYQNVTTMAVEVDDWAVGIQEEADSAYVDEMEKAVVLRVQELLTTVSIDQEDQKWSLWLANFREKWLTDMHSGGKSITCYDVPPSYSTFFKNDLNVLLPCMITGLGSDWSSCRDWRIQELPGKWKPNYTHLRTNYGAMSVSVTTSPLEPAVTMSFAEFLDTAEQEQYCYARDMHFARAFSHDSFYACPELFQDDWLNFKLERQEQDDYKFVYMGTDGTGTKLHKDVVASHSWSTNITGHKKWTLIPPSASHLLFTFDKEEVVSDIYDNDPLTLARWPHLEQVREAAITVFQKPGETIFVPSTWYHQVKNIGTTLSINHNWINAVSLSSIFDNLSSETEMSAEAVKDLKDDGVVSNSVFVEVVQELTLANAGMNWQTFFDLILFRFEHEKEYISPDMRPSKEYEAAVVKDVCDRWKTLADAEHLANVNKTIEKILELTQNV